MENVIAIGVLLLLVGGAIFYILRSKKRGAKCMGCPYSKGCKSNCCCSNDDPEK